MSPFFSGRNYSGRSADKNLSKIISRMGYGREIYQYYYLYRHELTNWASHISNTRQFITDCARRCCGRRTCIVLGSGWCLDVPVLELSRMFDTVYLVDAVHPDKVEKKASEFKNVRFVTEDITQIVAETYNSVTRYKDFCPDVLMSAPNYINSRYSDNLGDFDFVVSVNTLPFLAGPIISYLLELELIKDDDISSRSLEEFLQQYHLKILPKGKSCVVSPVGEKKMNADGLEMYDKSIVYFPPSVVKDSKSWIWNYSSGPGRMEYNVKAWEY